MIVFFIWYFKHKYNVNDNMQKLSFRIILTNYRIIKLRPIALNIRLLPGFLSSLFIYIFLGHQMVTNFVLAMIRKWAPAKFMPWSTSNLILSSYWLQFNEYKHLGPIS